MIASVRSRCQADGRLRAQRVPRITEAILLSFSDRVLGLHLGLGDLQLCPPCHGYANACICIDCMAREQLPKPAPAPQPWERVA